MKVTYCFNKGNDPHGIIEKGKKTFTLNGKPYKVIKIESVVNWYSRITAKLIVEKL